MDNSKILQLTDDELISFFDQFFPCGFAGEDVLSEIAPEGWQCSPLLSAFLDGFLSRKFEKSTLWEGDYMRFYMGTMWLQVRVDLKVVYTMIFRRLKLLGADWVYRFPEIHLVDFTQLREELESSTVYSSSEGWEASQEHEQRQIEVDKMQAELTAMNAQSRKEDLDQSMPSTVREYYNVYGRNPRGWPLVTMHH